jgi:hypothetical protein
VRSEEPESGADFLHNFGGELVSRLVPQRIKKQRARIDMREVDGFLAESHPW